MNFTPGRSGVSNPRRLLEHRDEGREVFASKGESDHQCPIIRWSRDSFPYCQASFARASLRVHCVPPLHRPCVIFTSLVAVLLEVLPGTTQRYLSSTTLYV